MKFYHCSSCGQIILKSVDTNQSITCCNQEMDELKPISESDPSDEHHIHIRKIGNFVTLSLINHPTLEVHHIRLIGMETNQGFQYKLIKSEQLPKAEFILAKAEDIINVYAICNIHLLFSTH